MIEDTELALELEVERKRQEAIKKKYVDNLSKIQTEMKEQDNNTSRSIQIINQQLEILKLEFQIEEAELEAPEKFIENIDINIKNGQSCCPTNEIKVVQANSKSSSLSEYFHVKNAQDLSKKLEKIQQRYDQMHKYGINYCNHFSRSETYSVLLCSMCCFFCPVHSFNYFSYHCYAGITNCCYKMGSRTEKILKVYQGFQKYSNHSSLATKNQNKIEELQQLLSQNLKIRKQALDNNGNTLEIFNTKLESLKLQMQNEDLGNEGQVQTIGQGRKIAGCFTYSLQLEKVPCDAKNLKEYFEVRSPAHFFANLKKLEEKDKKLVACKWDCCHAIVHCFMGELKQQAQVYQKSDQYDNNKHQSNINSLCCLYPVYEVLIAPFMCPFLLTYTCCESFCDGIYRRRSRIHELYQLYNDFRSRFVRNQQ